MAKTRFQKNCLKISLVCWSIILLLLLSGCFTGWSKKDKVKFGGFVVLQGVDTYQSVGFIDDGSEVNFLYTSKEALFIGKVISTGLIYGLADYFPEARPAILNTGCVLMGGVVIWNLGKGN